MDVLSIVMLIVFIIVNIMLTVNMIVEKKLTKLQGEYRDEIIRSNNNIHTMLDEFVAMLKKAKDERTTE